MGVIIIMVTMIKDMVGKKLITELIGCVVFYLGGINKLFKYLVDLTVNQISRELHLQTYYSNASRGQAKA